MMDPFEEIRYLGWDLEGVEDFEYSPSHSTLSERLKKTLYLAEECHEGMSLPVADTAVELFQGVSGSPLKKISPRHVANLSKRSRVAPCTLLLAMIYARRLKTMNEVYVKNMTAPDLLLVSMMVASKFLYDEGEDEEMFSDEWAAAANVDLNRVYKLEREFLSAMDWNLFVHNEEFFEFIREFETRIALSQGLTRGWFSYSDMEILMAQTGWLVSCRVVVRQAIRVVGMCVAIYTMCAATMIWSSIVLHHTALRTPCTGVVFDTHIQKSTLRHPPYIGSSPSLDSGMCHDESFVKESTTTYPPCNESSSQTTDSCDLESGNTSGVTGTIWDMTTALNQKYQAAHSALVIFYQALLTSLQDIRYGCDAAEDVPCCGCDCLADEETKAVKADGFSPRMGRCRCQKQQAVTCSRPAQSNMSDVGPCQCHVHGMSNSKRCHPSNLHHNNILCRIGHLGECKKQETVCYGGHCTTNGSELNLCQCQAGQMTDPSGHPDGNISNIGAWLLGWLMGGAQSCSRLTPDLKYRFMDLDMRFATISY